MAGASRKSGDIFEKCCFFTKATLPSTLKCATKRHRIEISVIYRAKMKPHFYNLTLGELEEYFVSQGEKKFRAGQLYRWVYGRGVTDVEAMSDMSKDLRARLPELFDWSRPKLVSDLLSVDGTRKFLFQIEEGMTYESVLIPSKGRLTLCVSSEVGCNMACQFCFTGKQKLKRRLTAGEIVN